MQTIGDLWYNMKWFNIWVFGVSKGKTEMRQKYT